MLLVIGWAVPYSWFFRLLCPVWNGTRLPLGRVALEEIRP